MLSFIVVIVWGVFFSESESVQIFYHLYCHRRSSYQQGRVGIPLTGLTPTPFCACAKPGPGFSESYAVDFFVFSELRWAVGIPLTGLTFPRSVPVPTQDLDFQYHIYVWYFCVQWVKVRGHCSFCWYWCGLLTITTFTFSYHKANRTITTWKSLVRDKDLASKGR